jgi:hypothetical protein
MNGIPFSTPMVLALLNTKIDTHPAMPIDVSRAFKRDTRRIPHQTDYETILRKGPRYRTGETYVVREGLYKGEDGLAYYQADDTCVDRLADAESCWGWKRPRLPSIFMPDKAGRVWVHTMSAQLEELQAMKGIDCVWEGLLIPIEELDATFGPGRWGALEEASAYLKAFAELIDSLHSPGTWASNPWVWHYTLKRVQCPKGNAE